MFDPAADRLDGYPETVCRRCASIISNFAIFKKSVESGQEKLRIIAEARKNRLKLAKEAAEADMVPMLLNFFSLSLAVRQTKLECLTRQAFLSVYFCTQPRGTNQSVCPWQTFRLVYL